MKKLFAGKRIFITEDNTNNRVIYMMILKLAGAEVKFDRWGNKTISQIANFRPNLIILDLMLSRDTSGYTVFKNIREQNRFDKIPIVAISASDPSQALPQCQQLGFSGFIAKPIDEELILEQLLDVMSGTEVWYAGERYGGAIPR